MIEIKMEDGHWYPIDRGSVYFTCTQNRDFILGRYEWSLSYWVMQLCLAGF